MTPDYLLPLLKKLHISLEPPAPIANAPVRRVLQPGHRAHQLHLLRWAAAQLSALVGVLIILLAIDFTQWLPDYLDFLDVFARFGDYTTYLPSRWRWVGIVLALGGFLVQLPLSFLSLWAERRTTWYVVSDQGVQLRYGLWTVNETSLRFANIQQVTLRQGPVQRVLGLADVVLQTAGGRPKDDDDDDEKRKRQGQLKDLEYAQAQNLLSEIRNQLPAASAEAARLTPPPAPIPSSRALSAAQHLLTEARALRQTLQPNSESAS
ncbi:MAG: PH domain-containing protein [Anaerolineales bacterium]|nr:PH domain-containing protein [Anaerolineales bacterium]